MKELDAELWKLGILAKTEHNEVAPAQHEMAPIFTTVNICLLYTSIASAAPIRTEISSPCGWDCRRGWRRATAAV